MSNHHKFLKNCQNCKKSFTGTYKQIYCSILCSNEYWKLCKDCGQKYQKYQKKDQCESCYNIYRYHGGKIPERWNKNCLKCEKKFVTRFHKQNFCSKQCQKENNKINRRIAYRIENNIDLNIPIKIKKPNGSGHKEKQGYRFINKMRHPNASKSGRIYEHIFIMSEYLGRPLNKGETVHHRNGIKDDNRIENLELWASGHPGGQRVKDKIEWCLDFLSIYGEIDWIQKKEF